MHLTDGVLDLTAVAVTTAAAGGLAVYSSWGMKEEEIPKTSLMAGAFFVCSLINIPLGPSSVHPVLGGLMGLILGRRAPVAFLVALIFQALLFQHGGITTLGINTLLVALPALLVYHLFHPGKGGSVFIKGVLAGGLAVVGMVVLLVGTLLLTDQRFGEGFISVVHLLVIGHIPLLAIEGLLTGFALRYLYRVRPHLLKSR